MTLKSSSSDTLPLNLGSLSALTGEMNSGIQTSSQPSSLAYTSIFKLFFDFYETSWTLKSSVRACLKGSVCSSGSSTLKSCWMTSARLSLICSSVLTTVSGSTCLCYSLTSWNRIFSMSNYGAFLGVGSLSLASTSAAR